MQKLIHWKHNSSPTHEGDKTQDMGLMSFVRWVAFFFSFQQPFKIEQLTKLFVYFSINIHLQSCYTYIPTIQQQSSQLLWLSKKFHAWSLYKSSVNGNDDKYKTTRINTHYVLHQKTYPIQCSIFLSFINKFMIIIALMGKEKATRESMTRNYYHLEQKIQCSIAFFRKDGH